MFNTALNNNIIPHVHIWWSGAGRRYLLIDGRIRVSRTFAAGQKSDIGRYEVPWGLSLTDFGIGMINDDFHIDGI